MKLYSYEDVTEPLTQLSNKFGERLNTDDQEKLKKLIHSTKRKYVEDPKAILENLLYLQSACADNFENNELNILFHSATTAIKQLYAIQCLGETLEVFVENVDKKELEKKKLILKRFEEIIADIKEKGMGFEVLSYFRTIANYTIGYSKQLPNNPLLKIAKELIEEIKQLGGESTSKTKTQSAYSEVTTLLPNNDNAASSPAQTPGTNSGSESFTKIIAPANTPIVTLSQGLNLAPEFKL